MSHRTVLSIFLLLALSSVLWSQGQLATLNGTILDPAGAAIPGVAITARNVQTGVEYKTTSTSAGAYTLPYLPAGTYDVTASTAGFQTTTAQNVVLRVAQSQSMNITLAIGQVTESVTVSSAPPLLESGSAEIGRYISEDEYDAWPIAVSDGQRQIQQFIFSSLPGSVGGTFQGSINGGQQYSHEILVEGITLGRMDLSGGNNNEFSPSAEAVGEFKLQSGAMGAQYNGGQTAVANFNIKSGTNEFHGSLFYYHQNKSLRANTFANNARGVGKSPFIQNNYGWGVGGPVRIPGVYDGRNRTFFFTNLEDTDRSDFNVTGLDVRLPTSDIKQGNFARILDPGFTENAASGSVIGTDALGRSVIKGQIYDPASSMRLPDGTVVRDPFPGNIIPQTRFSNVASNVVNDVGITEPEVDRMLRNTSRIGTCCPFFNLTSWATKIDHNFSDSHRISGYFNRSKRTRNNGAYWLPIPGLPTNTLQLQRTPGVILRLSEDWTVSPTVLNHIAIGYNRFRNANQSVFINQGWAEKIGVRNTSDVHFPVFRFSGLPEQGGGIGNGGRLGSPNRSDSFNGSYVLADDLTIIKGAHTFRAGYQYTRYFYTERGLSGSGDYNFSPIQTHLPGFSTQTGHSFASFLLGAVQSANRSVAGLTGGYRHPEMAFYFMDDWKATPKLTFNLGLRWETIGGFSEVTDRMSILDLTRPNPAAEGRLGAYTFLDEVGGRSFQDRYYGIFGPRLGFAYRMTDKLVVRGGYGITNTPPIRNDWGFDFTRQGYSGSINVLSGTSPTGIVDDPAMFLDDPFPSLEGTLPNTDPGQNLFGGNSYLRPDSNRLPYIQNYNFTIQYELPAATVLEVAYIGNKGTRLWASGYDSRNALPTSVLSLGDTLRENVGDHPGYKPYDSFPDNQSVAQALRFFPHLGSIRGAYPYHANSNYNSLQVTATRHLTDGVAILAAYTWSKTIGYADNGRGGGGGSIQDVFNRGLERSVASFDTPHTFKFTWVYELPSKFRGVVGQVLNGWQLTGIHNYRTGFPLAISQSGVNNVLGTGSIRPDVTGGPQTVGAPEANADFANGSQYLNIAGFANSPVTGNGVPLRVGTAPRYLPGVRGFHGASEDFGLNKIFTIHEELSFELGAQFLNAFNRANRGGINTNINSANFGKFFGGGGGRNIQIEARLNF